MSELLKRTTRAQARKKSEPQQTEPPDDSIDITVDSPDSTVRATRSQTKGKQKAQQPDPQSTSSTAMPSTATQAPSNTTPTPHLSPGTPSPTTIEGKLYAIHRSKRTRQPDPSSAYSKYTKTDVENMLIKNFKETHGYTPGFHELHDTEIRRRIPPPGRVWTTIEEQVAIGQGTRLPDKFLGPRRESDGPEEGEFEMVGKVEDEDEDEAEEG